MSSDIEGLSADLGLRVEPDGIATVDARAVAHLDSLTFGTAVKDLPYELWVGLVLYAKPISDRTLSQFAERHRHVELVAALDDSDDADILYVQSTMSPPKTGREGKKWPAVVIFVFLEPEKFSRIYDAAKTAFMTPGSSFGLEIESMQFHGGSDQPKLQPFKEWRLAHRPLIASADVDFCIRPDGSEAGTLRLHGRLLAAIALLGALALLVQWVR